MSRRHEVGQGVKQTAYSVFYVMALACCTDTRKGRAMLRRTIFFLFLAVFATGCHKPPLPPVPIADAPSSGSKADVANGPSNLENAAVAETRFLTFQLMTGFPGYAGPPPPPGHLALSKAQLETF